MDNENKIQLFEDKRIRTAWDEEAEEWYFSIVDVVSVLTDQPTPRSASTYWAVLKKRLIEEGFQLLTNCKQLKLKAADGKRYKTDVLIRRNCSALFSPSRHPKPNLLSSGLPRLEVNESKKQSTLNLPLIVLSLHI